MSSKPPAVVRRAAALLAADARRFEPVSQTDADAAVDAAARAIRARVVRRARRRWALGAGAAAAAVLAIVGANRALHRSPDARGAAVAAGGATSATNGGAAPPSAVLAGVHGSVLAVSGGETSRVVEGRAAKAGDRFVALRDGGAALALSSGTRLTLEGGGDLVWLEQGASHVFGVAAGAVRADVAKLSPGERFVLRTDDAEVEVRGTSFRVTRAPSRASCGGGTTTRVEVFEGVVSVRAGSSETRVAAGGTWPAGCDDTSRPGSEASLHAPDTPMDAPPRPTAPTTATSPAHTAATRAPESPPRVASAPDPSAGATARASDLAAQNDLFDEALAEERRGDTGLALATFERFERRYPASPLAENALAARMKMLRQVDRSRARDAARAYLQKYPAGFARADAQALLESEGSP